MEDGGSQVLAGSKFFNENEEVVSRGLHLFKQLGGDPPSYFFRGRVLSLLLLKHHNSGPFCGVGGRMRPRKRAYF